nr:hypothetical protein Iba_chr04eCG14830 [Ipomoea batatas]
MEDGSPFASSVSKGKPESQVWPLVLALFPNLLRFEAVVSIDAGWLDISFSLLESSWATLIFSQAMAVGTISSKLSLISRIIDIRLATELGDSINSSEVIFHGIIEQRQLNWRWSLLTGHILGRHLRQRQRRLHLLPLLSRRILLLFSPSRPLVPFQFFGRRSFYVDVCWLSFHCCEITLEIGILIGLLYHFIGPSFTGLPDFVSPLIRPSSNL